MQNIEPIDYESEYREIVRILREYGGKMDYKSLNKILSDRFEGVRLRLKTMKDRNLVEFEGQVPSFDSIIRIGEKARLYRY